MQQPLGLEPQQERTDQLRQQELLVLVLERLAPGQQERTDPQQELGPAPERQEQMDPLPQQALVPELRAFPEQTDHRPDQPLASRY